MDIVLAALGSPAMGREALAAAIDALSSRSDFEPATDANGTGAPWAIRIRAPWGNENGAWAGVELRGEDSMAMLVDTAAALAAHVRKPVHVIAAGFDPNREAPRGLPTYRSYEVFADGTKRLLLSPAADRFVDRIVDRPVEPTGDAATSGAAERTALAELVQLLVERADAPADWLVVSPGSAELDTLREAPAEQAPSREPTDGRLFRRRVVIDDPRLAKLAATIIAAKAVWFAADPSGRVRLKIDATDGGKQISFVSTDEAVTLRRATNRSWIALEPA